MRAGIFVTLALVCACGGSGPKKQPAGPAPFRISVDPADVPISPGSARWITVTIDRDAGFDAAVTVGVEGPPTGLLADELVLASGVNRDLLLLAVDDAAKVGDMLVSVVATEGSNHAGASVTLHVGEPRPSSAELIGAAREAGEIDLATSLLYRCYARAGDGLLPAKFRGEGSEDLGLGDDIEAATPGLTTEQLAVLQPYVVRPGHPDSVYTQARSGGGLRAGLSFPGETCAEGQAWRSRRSTMVPVRVWIECLGEDAGEQSKMAKALDTAEKVWGPIKDLMGDPLLDLGGDDEGGDDAIDVYLVQGGIQRNGETHDAAGMGDAAAYTAYSPPQKDAGGVIVASSFVVAPRDVALTESARGSLVHELFHVFQFARNRGGVFKNGQVHWFVEASAAWAKVHFDRTITWPRRIARFEHTDRFYAFQRSDLALNATLPVKHTYAAYAWPLFLELTTVGPGNIVGNIWRSLQGKGSFADVDAAIDQAAAFKDNFRIFAVRNLNHPFLPGDPLPEKDRYVHLDDQFPDAKYPPTFETASLSRDAPYTLPLTMPPLSARYVHVKPLDPSLGKVVIDVTGLQPMGSLTADALIETSTGWVKKPVPLDDDGETVFCFDEGPATETVRGSFKSIDSVLSNHAFATDGTVAGDLKITAKGEPCGVWSGSASFSLESEDEHSKLVLTFDATVALEFDDEAMATGGIPLRLRAGSYSYRNNLDNYDGGCQGHGASGGAMHRGEITDSSDGATIAQAIIYADLDPVQYTASGLTFAKTTYYSNCNDQHTEEETGTLNEPITWWGAPGLLPLEDDGTTMKGTFEQPGVPTGTYRWTWNLKKVRE